MEKHFTLDKTLQGNDHYHAMDSYDAEEILAAIERINCLKGTGELQALASEQAARENARRSIVAAVDISEGTVLTEDMLTFKRPGTGISPHDLPMLLGKVAGEQIQKDSIMKWDMVKNPTTIR